MKEKIKNLAFLHLCIFIYTFTTIIAKVTSYFEFMSWQYLFGYAGMIVVLGIYAIIWQQAIKPFPASVAYANKSVTMIWTLLFSAVFFGEGITKNNIIGAILIMLGVVMVVRDVE